MSIFWVIFVIYFIGMSLQGGAFPSSPENKFKDILDKWKTDGKTPDGQMIWTKDSFRKVIPCR